MRENNKGYEGGKVVEEGSLDQKEIGMIKKFRRKSGGRRERIKGKDEELKK